MPYSFRVVAIHAVPCRYMLTVVAESRRIYARMSTIERKGLLSWSDLFSSLVRDIGYRGMSEEKWSL